MTLRLPRLDSRRGADQFSGDRISGRYEATVSQRETGTFDCNRPGS